MENKISENMEQKSLNEVVASNIYILRTNRKITQLELGEMINYSDKIISKWERAESIPNLEVLMQLSQIFNVPLDFFTKEHTEKEIIKPQIKPTINTKTVAIFSLCGLWAILTILFVAIYATLNIALWQVFVWAVPASFILLIVFSSIWYKAKYVTFYASLLLWSLLGALYIQFMLSNLWTVFLIGIPCQIAILFIKKIIKK